VKQQGKSYPAVSKSIGISKSMVSRELGGNALPDRNFRTAFAITYTVFRKLLKNRRYTMTP
jgi:hypothetical protein